METKIAALLLIKLMLEVVAYVCGQVCFLILTPELDQLTTLHWQCPMLQRNRHREIGRTPPPGGNECAELHIPVLYPKLRQIKSLLSFRRGMSWRQRGARIITSMDAFPMEGKDQEEVMSVSHLTITNSFFFLSNSFFDI